MQRGNKEGKYLDSVQVCVCLIDLQEAAGGTTWALAREQGRFVVVGGQGIKKKGYILCVRYIPVDDRLTSGRGCQDLVLSRIEHTII